MQQEQLLQKKILTLSCQYNVKRETTANEFITIKNLKYNTGDANESDIIVRSEFITLQAYQEITTTKPKNTSNPDSLLANISDENLNITFSRFFTDYNVEVLYEVEKLNLNITKLNPDATLRIVGSQNLSLGDNVIDIFVTSPDKKSTTCYTLNVKRLARGESIYYPEKDATLSGLSFTGVAFKFDPTLRDFNLNVRYDLNDIEVNATTKVEGAKVTVTGNNDIKTGSIITLIVTSKDGTTKEKYTFKIKKQKEAVDYIPYIVIGGLVLVFIVIVGIMIYLNNRSKKDPVLYIKHDKRKLNRGKKMDESIIPDATLNNEEDVDILM